MLFKLDNSSVIKLMNLAYLDINSVNKIYVENLKYGDIYIFITGIKTDITDPVYQAKNTLYFIVYSDQDSIKRFMQIKKDINYFYDVFNHEFMKTIIRQNLPSNLDNNILQTFYKNLEMNKRNINKNYINVLINEENDNLVKNIFVNVFKNKKKVDEINIFNSIHKNNNKCTFIPLGDTLFECKQLCSNDINLSCTEEQCNNICNNCYTEKCKWNFSKKQINNSIRPNISKIKGFSGNKFIKVTWLKPESKSEILKYYIIVTSPINTDFIQIYSFYDERELPEYIIPNLENDVPYSVSLVSKNKIGVSKISNIETIIPNEYSEIDRYDRKNSYDNSLQNVNSDNNIIDISTQKSMYEKQTIIQELKSILVNKLKFKKPIGAYNINIF